MTPKITRLPRAAVALLVFVLWLSADAQRPRIARIGVITSGSPITAAAWVDAFRQRLRELGYAEGRHVAIEVRYESGQPERLRAFAAELVGLGSVVIVASGTGATRAAKSVTSTIPIVMVSVGDAVGAGLVTSLARPSANITGQSFMGPEMALKQFDLLMETLPRAKRVAAIYNPDISSIAGSGALDAAAHSKGVMLQRIELRNPDDLDRALAAMGQTRPDASFVFAMSADQLNRIVEIAARNRLPAVYGFRAAVEAGGLMFFGPKLQDLWRGAANYVDKILKGAKPGELPVEQPTEFELVINLKTAKALGLTIPPSLLRRADAVIQ